MAQRTHDCPNCGLQADRDIVSATLAACIQFANANGSGTARVNYLLARALRARLASQQEARAQSTGTSPLRNYAAGSARTGSHHRWPLLGDAFTTRLTPEQPGQYTGRRGSSRKTKL
ncbi:MAG: hypothetical protein WAN71_00245 [Mycobacterium sp.]